MFSNVSVADKFCTCHLCTLHISYYQITQPCVVLSSVHIIVRWQDKRFVTAMMDERLAGCTRFGLADWCARPTHRLKENMCLKGNLNGGYVGLSVTANLVHSGGWLPINTNKMPHKWDMDCVEWDWRDSQVKRLLFCLFCPNNWALKIK